MRNHHGSAPLKIKAGNTPRIRPAAFSKVRNSATFSPLRLCISSIISCDMGAPSRPGRRDAPPWSQACALTGGAAAEHAVERGDNRRRATDQHDAQHDLLEVAAHALCPL